MTGREGGSCKIILPPNLREALFVSRKNRFVGEIDLDGSILPAHVPSSGRMAELLRPGARVFVAGRDRSGPGLRYRILLADYGGTLVSVDSLLPNRLVRLALINGCLPEFQGCRAVKPEAAYGRGRFDFFFRGEDGAGCYLEVKSVTLVDRGVALFPDAPSERGARHMEELATARGEGFRAAVLFVIQREDALCFRPHRDRDPLFSRALSDAASAGVEVLARSCRVTRGEVSLDDQLPVCLE